MIDQPTSATNFNDIPIDELISSACKTIAELDEGLGRPPFPNPTSQYTRQLARHARDLINYIVGHNRLQSLAKCEAVSTTLPILCASLRSGSQDGVPCMKLFTILLDTLTPVASLSTYPLTSVLQDAYELLPGSSSILFRFVAAAGGLSVERMYHFLGMPPPAGASEAAPAARGAKKKKQKSAHSAPQASQTAPLSAALSPHVSHELLRQMFEAKLPADCAEILFRLCNSTSRFLNLVGDDGALADVILGIYGAHLLPHLRPSSMLRCLDKDLLDYFVDAVQAHGDGFSLLTDKQFVSTSAEQWHWDRIGRLSEGTSQRRLAVADSFGSLLTSVFLLTVAVTKRNSALASGDCSVPPASEFYRWMSSLWQASARAAALLADDMHSGPRDDIPSTCGSGTQRSPDGGLLISKKDERWIYPLAILVSLSRETVLDFSFSFDAGASADGAQDFRQAFHHLRDRIVLSSLRQITSAEPRPTQAAVKQRAADPSKKRGGKKSNESTTAGPAKEAPKSVHPSPSDEFTLRFNWYLLYVCQVLWFTDVITKATDDDVLQRVAAVADGFNFAHQHQAVPIDNDVWVAFLEYMTLAGWRHRLALLRGEQLAKELNVPVRLQDELQRATHASSQVTWVYPIVCCQSDHTPSPVSAWSPLLLQTIAEAALRRRASSPREPWRVDFGMYTKNGDFANSYPPTPLAILGWLCYRMAEPQLGRLCTALLDSACRGNQTTLPMKALLADDPLPKPNDDSDQAVGEFAACSSGLEALYKELSAQHQRRTNTTALEKEREEERRRDLLQQKILQDADAINKHRSFEARQAEEEANRRQQREGLRAAQAAKVAAREQRRAEQRRLREEKQQIARQVLAESYNKARAQRVLEERARFQRYRERLQSNFRVSVFLSHLQLSASRTQEVVRSLHQVLDVISPDDLLEFLVTGGSPRVPDDMTEGVEAELAPMRTPFTGDVWMDVMRSEGGPSAAASDAQQPARQSFHRRAKPILDLFCYEGGDEYGSLPDPLPSIKVSTAHRVLCRGGTGASGAAAFEGVDEVDALLWQLRDKGVLTIASGVAQLTRVGFRYHFPFHDADRMLEVQIQARRERIQKLLGAKDTGSALKIQTNSGEDDEEDEEEDDDEEEKAEEKRILPEIEFGI